MVSKATTQTGVQRQMERRKREKQELARSRAAAGANGGSYERAAKEGYARQLAQMPVDDPRSLTGRLMGDPVRGDVRRHWAPWLNKGNPDA